MSHHVSAGMKGIVVEPACAAGPSLTRRDDCPSPHPGNSTSSHLERKAILHEWTRPLTDRDRDTGATRRMLCT